MSSTSTSPILNGNAPLENGQCAACGTENASDSRFCRQCGAALVGAPPLASVAENTNGNASGEAPVVTTATEAENGAPSGEATSPSVPEEIDARRAKQLLDRALHFAEIKDLPAAVLACRQSIALMPNVVAGHSLLGNLLERSGDTAGAISAYEKVLELAPNSSLERDNLARLRERETQTKDSGLFQFNEAELFGSADDSAEATVALGPEPAPEPTQKPEPAPVVAPVVPPVPVVAPVAAPVAVTVSDPVSASDSLLDDNRRATDRRKASIPVVAERRRQKDRRVPRPASLLAPPAPAAPVAAYTPVVSTPWQTKARPAYYTRGLPLVAATVLSLGFLAWARSSALSKSAVAPPTAPTQTIVDGPPPPPQNLENSTPNVPQKPAQATDANGFPINNKQPLVATRPATAPAPPVSNPAPNTPNPNSSTPARPSAPVSSPPARNVTPNFPSTSIAPAPIPKPAPVNGGIGPLPAPRISAPPAPAAPSTVLSPDFSGASSSGSSTGGTPIKTTGQGSSGYVKVTQGRIPPPSRPGQAARDDESRAASAARAGQNDRAINSLTNAINNSDPSEAGSRYQQRATLFLQQGDAQRAISDFQSAISAYQSQINNGEDVAQARAGLRTCQSGLRLALAQRR